MSAPTLFWLTRVHLLCSGVTSSPSALLGHGLGPTGPQISHSGQGEVLVPLPHSQLGTWGSQPLPQPYTRSRHSSPWPLGKRKRENIRTVLEGMFRA